MRKQLNLLAGHILEHGLVRGLHILKLKSRKRSTPARISSPQTGGPVLIRPGTSDMAIYDQIVLQPYLPIISDARVIIDLGANIGLTVRYWSAGSPQAKIIAVEPDEENFSMLQANTSGMKDVHCIKAAIWPVHEQLHLNKAAKRSSSFHVEAVNTGGDVEVITMSDLFKKYNIDRVSLLKIDIEGAELELFSGPDLSWLERVDALAIELHDHVRPGCGDAFFKAMTKQPWNYTVHGEMILCKRIT
ncbi:MAG: FkbM family methyltransferase [Flavobacteriales bacterium]|nr:FkbM family methyltransferase [Flavobacteriales bacterium]